MQVILRRQRVANSVSISVDLIIAPLNIGTWQLNDQFLIESNAPVAGSKKQ